MAFRSPEPIQAPSMRGSPSERQEGVEQGCLALGFQGVGGGLG